MEVKILYTHCGVCRRSSSFKSLIGQITIIKDRPYRHEGGHFCGDIELLNGSTYCDVVFDEVNTIDFDVD